MGKYILFLTMRAETFIIEELKHQGKYLGISFDLEDDSPVPKNPFLIARFHSDEDAIRLANRSISVRSLYKFCFTSKTFESLLKQDYKFSFTGTYKCVVDGFNKSIKMPEKLSMIEEFVKAFGITNPVSLKKNENEILIAAFYKTNDEEKPEFFIVGTLLCSGNSKLPDKFMLKKRSYINTTTMKPDIALHSAIQGLLGPGKLMYDPFCGSGSLLIAGATLGAYVIGSDYEWESMMGKPDGKTNVYTNFERYGIKNHLIGFMKSNFLSDTISDSFKVDAIVTDPPYGVRERPSADDQNPLLTLLLKLYSFASKHLVVGGRLVFWLPTNFSFDSSKELPRHPALKLISDCEQYLTSRYCRHLITLEKVEEIDADVIFDADDPSYLHVREMVFDPIPKYQTSNQNMTQ